jgi:hypothetical protein
VDRREGARLEQIFWRRSKIPEIGGSVDYFKREYLLTPDEAFMASILIVLLQPTLLIRARKVKDIEPYGPLIIGVDLAGKGADSTAIAWRQTFWPDNRATFAATIFW